MSASNLLPQEKPAKEKPAMDRNAYEPSMEEILASIRRIIADDQAFPASQPTPAPDAGKQGGGVVEPSAEAAQIGGVAAQPAAAPPAPHSPRPAEAPNVMERVTEVASVAPARRVDAARLAGIRVEGRLLGEAVWPRSPIEPQRAPPNDSRHHTDAPQPSEPRIDAPLVSAATDQAVSAAFNALVASRFLPTDEDLTDMVGDMIRPMLKAWLDDNLPIMVERLVRAEIERVARGGR